MVRGRGRFVLATMIGKEKKGLGGVGLGVAEGAGFGPAVSYFGPRRPKRLALVVFRI